MYATQADMEARFGVNEISNLKAMQTVENAIEQALQDAVEEIDSYVAVKYQLPLPEVPSTLKRIACNIARYRLYFQRPTEEVENRYKAEIDFLKRIADGRATLNILNTQNQVTTEKPLQTPSTMPIGTSYVGGVFGDDTLNKMPSFK
ncbi:gp436 family protein [Acinetobacter radioresistens]|uniref:gp436 family protein n=2 Tax=Acinetobacter radioresistens TaxID=40216 RepID=UPI0032160A76